MVIAFLCGCEIIPENERLILTEADPYGNRTHVLLEFTGFRCVNCPTAAETAQTLHGLYGDQLTVVALHPASNPFTQGKYDYTCPAADSIYLFMSGTATTSFPTGNIDMKPINDRWFFDYAEWPAEVSKAMEDSICPPLWIETELDTTNKEISISASFDYYFSSARNAQLALWLVEDSVKGVQAMPDGSVNMEYYHRHVLRAVADDKPFGLPTTPDMMTGHIPLPEECNPDHCTIVALLLDNQDYHILQAYETKLDYSHAMPPVDD